MKDNEAKINAAQSKVRDEIADLERRLNATRKQLGELNCKETKAKREIQNAQYRHQSESRDLSRQEKEHSSRWSILEQNISVFHKVEEHLSQSYDSVSTHGKKHSLELARKRDILELEFLSEMAHYVKDLMALSDFYSKSVRHWKNVLAQEKRRVRESSPFVRGKKDEFQRLTGKTQEILSGRISEDQLRVTKINTYITSTLTNLSREVVQGSIRNSNHLQAAIQKLMTVGGGCAGVDATPLTALVRKDPETVKNSMQLLCQTYTRPQRFAVGVEPTDTVKQVKMRLTSEHGLPPDALSLFHKKTPLEDSKTVANYKLKHNDVLNLIIKFGAADLKPERPVPDEFKCPLANKLMVDPVWADDGETYERCAIVAWQKEHGTAPGGDEPLPAMFCSNRRLKKQIQAWENGAES